MYEFFIGEIDYVHPEYIVLNVNGIGYRILCPNPFTYKNAEKSQVKIYTYHYVRDDASLLYGFPTREEKALFSKLLSVSGIGPKGGLAILATGEPMQVVAAIENEDEKFLMKFPGVGKKTARQMILDLKGKLSDFSPDVDVLNEQTNERLVEGDVYFEVTEALRALGYAEREIKKVLPQLKGESLAADELIKKALQLLIQS